MEVTYEVAIRVSDLAVSAAGQADNVRRALEEQGARNIDIEVSEDDTDLSIAWTLDAADREEASERGHLALDAVTADECSWQVSVAQYFVTT